MSFGDWNNYIRYVKIKEHTFGSWTIDGRWCTALLTMLLREDHFSNGSFDRRFADGQVLPVLVRMKDVLSAGV